MSDTIANHVKFVKNPSCHLQFEYHLLTSLSVIRGKCLLSTFLKYQFRETTIAIYLLWTILPSGLRLSLYVIRKLLLLQMLLLSYVAVLAYRIFYILIRARTLRVPYLVKYSKRLAFIKPGQQRTIHRAMEW